MTKNEFLAALRNSLGSLPDGDAQKSIDYYSEIIDDRVEDGISEDEAVASLGSIEDIVSQIIADIPISKLVKQKSKSRRKLKTWEIVLLAAGSPLWIVLLAAVFVIILSVYIAIWSVAITFFAISISLGACALGCLLSPIYFAVIGKPILSVLGEGVALLLGGLAVFSFIGSLAFARLIVKLTKKIIISIKSSLAGKEEAK